MVVYNKFNCKSTKNAKARLPAKRDNTRLHIVAPLPPTF